MALGATFFYYYPVMVCPIPKQYMELHILQSTKENHQLMLVHISVKKIYNPLEELCFFFTENGAEAL